MRGAIFALVAVAILAAGGAAFFANRMMSGPRTMVSSDLGEPMPATGLMVLVAATDIDPGKAVGPGAVRWQPWPDDMVRPEYIKTDPRRDDTAARAATAARIEGRLARRHIAAGEPLTESKVFERQTVGFLAGTLNSGMRAMSVAITAESGAGGFVLPGDQVDVILSHDITRSLPRTMQDFGSDAGVVKHAAETVLENVRVLAVDQTVSKNADGEAVVGKTATLEVTPENAQVLALAANMGSLSLSLRSLDAGSVENVAASSSDVAVSPVLARAMASAERRSEASAGPRGAPQSSGVAPAAKPTWSVSIFRGGVSRVQTVDGQ